MKAVSLYIKLRKRLGATLRQLGYPTKNSLKAWYRELKGNGDLRLGCRRQKHSYTEAQKRHAVDFYAEQGQCLAHTVRTLGYLSRETMRFWIRELRPDLIHAITRSSHQIVYSVAQKQEAVIQLGTRAGIAREVAQEIGVSRTTLYSWQTRLCSDPRRLGMKTKRKEPFDGRSEALAQEARLPEARVQRLRLEHDILNKANELLKKDHGVDPQQLTSLDKT